MLPQIDSSWKAINANVSIPSGDVGWTTDIRFETADGQRTIRFVRFDRYVPIWEFLMGFDEVQLEDQDPTGKHCREYGRYRVHVTVDGDCSSFEVDEVMEIT